MKRRKASKKRRRIFDEKRLIAYIAAAGAALASASADATVIYTPADVTMNSGTTSYDINMDGIGGAEFGLRFTSWVEQRTTMNLTGSFTTYYGGMEPIFSTIWYDVRYAQGSIQLPGTAGTKAVVVDPSPWAANLPFGAPIFSGLSWKSNGQPTLFSHYFNSFWGSTTTMGNLNNGNPGYIGVAFDPGDGFKPGWIHVDSVAGDLSSYHVDGWAYEDTGEAIILAGQTVSAIPEPSSLALLATGAAGIATLRRKKKQ